MNRWYIAMIGVLIGYPFTLLGTENKPATLTVKVYDYYKYRSDGKAGRSIVLEYRGKEELTSHDKVEIYSRKGNESFEIGRYKADSIPVLLHPDLGVNCADTIVACLTIGNECLTKEVVIPAMRHWTVYIYPHSHVDIGYTNTQENVEFIHKRNLDIAMDLADKTRNYPEDARFRWNPEVVWPVERYLHSESPQKKKRLLDAIRRGDISVDAGYVSTNTSASSDEELLQLFTFGKELEKETDRPVRTMVQTDIPGMSWGVVTAANQRGIDYVLSLFNGSDRTGWTHSFSFHPFWWVAPDGKSKVLFLQPGAYTPGALAKGKYFWPKLAGQIDSTKLLPVVKTDHPRENFIDSYLADMLPRLEQDKEYPYDVFPMTWCMADNTPIDADLPDAVKSWNEEYAFPHLKICTATDIMQTFDERWGKQIPVLQGDFTEYWTDGLGSSAEKTGESREVKEKLVQSQILWSMLRPKEGEPEDLIKETWRNIILSTEHTWAFMDPYRQPIQDNILKTKFRYFDTAKQLTNQLQQEAIAAIEDKNSTQLSVFNTDSWERSGLVTLPEGVDKTYGRVVDETGKEVVCQRLQSGNLVFWADKIPALGYRNYKLVAGENKQTSILQAPSTTQLDNGIVSLRLDPLTGDVVELRYQNEEFVDAEALVALNSYRYLEGDNSAGRAHKPMHVRISVGESGPLVNSLIIESEAKGCNSLRREVRLLQGSAAVEFDNIVDKQAILDKEGIHFGFAFDVPQSTVRVNIPWGVMELEKDQLKAGNRNWIAMQRWLDVSNAEKGVTWCSLNACAFESGDMTANIIGGAYESPRWIRKLQPSSTIYSWALNNHWHTNFRLSQDGKIGFKYRLLPYVGAYDVVRSNRFAIEQYRPLVVVRTKADFRLGNRFMWQGSDRVTLSNYQTVDKGKKHILRLFSFSEQEEPVSLIWEKKQPKSIVYYQDRQAVRLPKKENTVVVPAKGVVTVEVNW